MKDFSEKLKPQINAWADALAELPSSEIFCTGIERETLRTDSSGVIAATPHPDTLGLALTNRYITTDFAEALLEIVTPPFAEVDELYAWLRNIHRFVLINIGNSNDELLWPASMPSIMPDPDGFTIAEYGSSHQGQIRHIYRKGLSHRYGRRMQAIAGIHLNISFSEKFLNLYNKCTGQDYCQNSFLFHIMRNFMRYNWLVYYLFGRSPALDASFFGQGKEQLDVPSFLHKHKNSSYYSPTSSCLRMGKIGYTNKRQDFPRTCFNDLETYIDMIRDLTARPDAKYQSIGTDEGGVKNAAGEWLQLNANVLQIENEYYAAVRPKAARKGSEKTIDVLSDKGVEYLEIRSLDIDPSDPCGISAEQIRFMQLFLLYLGILPSPDITDEECHHLKQHEEEIIMTDLEEANGKPRSYKSFDGGEFQLGETAQQILSGMADLAELLDKSSGGVAYSKAVKQQQEILAGQDGKGGEGGEGGKGGKGGKDGEGGEGGEDGEGGEGGKDGGSALPAAKQLRQMQEQDKEFSEIMLELGKQHKRQLLSEKADAAFEDEMQQEVKRSVAEEQEILNQQTGTLDEFIADYLS